MGSRAIASVLMVAMSVVAFAIPASAGGSWLRPIEKHIQPGDTITLVGFSGFEPGEGFVPEDTGVTANDRFWLYLDPKPDATDLDGFNVFEAAKTQKPVGELIVTPTGQAGYQSYRLHVTFKVPEGTPTGFYDVRFCNDPCTVNIWGELVGGWFVVGDFTKENLAEQSGISLQSVEDWSKPQANLSDPLVAELLDQSELALTGAPTIELALVAGALLSIGIITLRFSRRWS